MLLLFVFIVNKVHVNVFLIIYLASVYNINTKKVLKVKK
jgi:hypothetical protein